MVAPISAFAFSPLSSFSARTPQNAAASNSAAPPTFTGSALASQNALAIGPSASPVLNALNSPAAFTGDMLALALVSSPNTNPFVGQLGNPGANSLLLPNAGTPAVASANIQNNSQLQQSIAKIQQDSTGAQLLQTALAKGYSIQVGDPAAASNEQPMQGVTVEGVTLTDSHQIIVSPNAGDFDKTLVHELYHAATDGDGDSKLEEATANIIGDTVSAAVNNRPRNNPLQILRDTLPLYPDLPLINQPN